MLHHGPIPDGMFVCHRCDVRSCVNPEHLFIGTDQENKDDMVAKGRQSRGEDHGPAELTTEQVQRIDALLRDGLSHTRIARMFSIDRCAVAHIEYGRTWGWLTGRELTAGEPYRGERNSSSVLTSAQVLEIVNLLGGALSHRQIGERFGVSANTVWNVANGARWGWLTGIVGGRRAGGGV